MNKKERKSVNEIAEKTGKETEDGEAESELGRTA